MYSFIKFHVNYDQVYGRGLHKGGGGGRNPLPTMRSLNIPQFFLFLKFHLFFY